MNKAKKYEVHTLQTGLVINEGNGKFTFKPLPFEAQLSPTYAFLTDDYDKDGKSDLMVLGNFFEAKPETGRMDANFGLILRGFGKGVFQAVPFARSGMHIRGQVRDAANIKVGSEKLTFIVQNNDKLLVFNQLY